MPGRLCLFPVTATSLPPAPPITGGVAVWGSGFAVIQRRCVDCGPEEASRASPAGPEPTRGQTGPRPGRGGWPLRGPGLGNSEEDPSTTQRAGQLPVAPAERVGRCARQPTWSHAMSEDFQMLKSFSCLRILFIFAQGMFLGRPGSLCLFTHQGGGPARRTSAWCAPRSGSCPKLAQGGGEPPLPKDEKEASSPSRQSGWSRHHGPRD